MIFKLELIRSRVRLSILIIGMMLATSISPQFAWSASAGEPKLKFAVILTRHGIRSPIWPAQQLNAYSRNPWPDWGVPPGNLTPQGGKLMQLFGRYYRLYFSTRGLLKSTGCEDAAHIYVHADAQQRTLETSRLLAAGMMPGCIMEVHSINRGKDPLFSPLAAGIAKPDKALAAASISGRIGSNPNSLVELYRHEFDMLNEVLFGCAPDALCPAEEKAGKQSLLLQASRIEPSEGSHAADLQGPLSAGSTLAEDFLLEYVNGMEGTDLGWGRLNAAKVLQLMRLHAAYADLARQTAYVARLQASNLLIHILRSMEQAVSQMPIPGSVSKTGDRVLMLVGHDTNISNVAGVLGLSWLLAGYQPDDTPPGGALVFELWQQSSGEFAVSTYYLAQSLEQMRKALPLTLSSPPLKSPIFVPGCSTADEIMSCSWKAFQRTVESAIDPVFVSP